MAELPSIFDLTGARAPSPQRQALLERRLARLESIKDSAASATTAFSRAAQSLTTFRRLELRPGFAYLSTPSGDGSDRRVPPRSLRPPATQIATSRGAALRLELTALALAQTYAGIGRHGPSTLPLLPDRGAAQPIGWVDLIASSAKNYSGNVYTTINDKKARQVSGALDRMADAGLVHFPRCAGARDIREGFVLLDERGTHGRPGLEPLAYRPPRASREAVFSLPGALLTRGWIHLLEDSELALLLMVACGYGRNPGEGDWIAIPGAVRLLNYGISRDAFEAHMLLRGAGLMAVMESGRRDDGRAFGYNEPDGDAHLHRLQLIEDGFDKPALETLTSAIKTELALAP